MSYPAYSHTLPVVSGDSRANSIAAVRDNFQVLLHAALFGGALVPGWNMEIANGSGTEYTFQYMYFKNGTKWLRATITWGTSGGSNGAPTQIVGAYSVDSGANYDPIGTATISYTANGSPTGIAWS